MTGRITGTCSTASVVPPGTSGISTAAANACLTWRLKSCIYTCAADQHLQAFYSVSAWPRVPAWPRKDGDKDHTFVESNSIIGTSSSEGERHTGSLCSRSSDMRPLGPVSGSNFGLMLSFSFLKVSPEHPDMIFPRSNAAGVRGCGWHKASLLPLLLTDPSRSDTH